jgi:hypothetical protein
MPTMAIGSGSAEVPLVPYWELIVKVMSGGEASDQQSLEQFLISSPM